MLQADSRKLAVIDIGSNTVRLQTSEVIEQSYRILEEYKDLTRLGDDVFKHGKLTEDGISRLERALTDIKNIMEGHEFEHVKAVATASFRKAENHGEVLDIIRDKYGIDVEIISGKEEARLTQLAASANFQLNKFKVLVVDIGGGSSELSVVNKGVLELSESFNLGCSLLTGQFLKSDPPKPSEIKAMKNFIKKEFSAAELGGIDLVICTGGSMNNIAQVHYGRSKSTVDTNVKYVERKFLKNFITELKWSTVEERKAISGLDEKRADNILPAPVQVDVLLELTNTQGFFTLTGGLRSGLTIDLINKMGIRLPFQKNQDDIRFSRILEIGDKFLYEKQHAAQVEKLCGIIFDTLKHDYDLDERDRSLLQAAAMLHDIGNYISYSKHHKHSYYLIMNSQMVGYDHEEQEIIANIARYHRKGTPKMKHYTYGRLTEEGRRKVDMLAGILRIADSFDRSYKSLVKDIDIKITKGKIIFKPVHDGDMSTEFRRFEIKKDLLEKVSKRKAVLV